MSNIYEKIDELKSCFTELNNLNITFDDLCLELQKSFTDKVKDSDKKIAIFLFGVKYGNLILKNNYSVNDIITKALIPEKFYSDIYSGISLSRYLIVRSDININSENIDVDMLKAADFSNSINNLNNVDYIEKIKQMYREKDYYFKSIDDICLKFKSLYGVEVLKSLSGKELLYRLFANKEMNLDSLIYNIEFNKEYEYFGGIGGGSSYKFKLYYSNSNQSWIMGTHKSNSRKITESEAIEYAEYFKDGFVKLCTDVANTDEDDINYSILFENAKSYLPDLYDSVWVLKSLTILYPDKFCCFRSDDWFNKASKILNCEFTGNKYAKNYQFRKISNEIQVPSIDLYHIIYKILGEIDTTKEIVDDRLESDMYDIIYKPRSDKRHPLNSILYGAPGTGKTYATAEYALAFLKNVPIEKIKKEYSDRRNLMLEYQERVSEGQIVFTTFHQNYSYEDFIQGLRPDTNSDKMKFNNIDGIFKKISDKALNNYDKNYVIIIDEINRANISKVFGELITLIEEDKRWGEVNQLSVTLPSGDDFKIPNNLYILGTMNSADKSISLIDTALRRRFNFIEVAPDSSLIKDEILKRIFEALNNKIFDELDTTDLLIGHGYFIEKNEDDLCSVLNNAIIPLLYEYYYDKESKVKDTLKNALECVKEKYSISTSKTSRIKVVKNQV